MNDLENNKAGIQFQTIDWASIEKIEHKGQEGTSFWQTIQIGGLRIRKVAYLPGYIADHWCQKGHIVHCLEGSFVSELSTGEEIYLTKDQSYVVSDGLSSHRSYSKEGVLLFIIDGDFLS